MVVDAHHHLWDLERVEYPWLGPELAPIDRSFAASELEPLLASAGVEATVLVQAACSDADTDYLLEQADAHRWIAAVVGWVPLPDPDACARALERRTAHPR